MVPSRRSPVLLLAAALLAQAPQQARGEAVDLLVTGSIPVGVPLPTTGLDRFPEIATLRAAAEAYRRGDIPWWRRDRGTHRRSPRPRAAEWIAHRAAGRSLGFERTLAFLAANPDLPIQRLLQRRAEDALIIERTRADRVIAFFRDRTPQSPNGRAALAIAQSAKGEASEAARLALVAYRDKALTRDVAEMLERAFPDLIGPAERVLRAHR